MIKLSGFLFWVGGAIAWFNVYMAGPISTITLLGGFITLAVILSLILDEEI